MRRAVQVVPVGLALLLTGCDVLLGIPHVDTAAHDASLPATSVVQQQTASSDNGLSLSVTLSGTPISGNVLVVIGASDRSNLAPPTGGGVALWTHAVGSNSNSNIEIWYGITDGADRTVTIACACSLSGNMRLSVSEWAGLDTANPYETGSSAMGVSSPGMATTMPITTFDSPDLLIFGVGVFGTGASEMAGWTALTPVVVDPAIQFQWYRLVDAPGEYSASVTVNGSWDAALAAFRAKP